MLDMHLVGLADVDCPFTIDRVCLSWQVVGRGGFLRRIAWVSV